MVKKKGSREMNPADAHRKAQRAKEIARNKKERKFQREAHALQTNPDAIKDELKEVLALEEDGKGNQTIRLKKKALQGAYDHALKKRKEEELRQFQPTENLSFSSQGGHGVLERKPEDSVYYHPMLNPTGVPPPGKPQRYKTSAAAPSSSNLAALPKPKPPPLPVGPAPHQAAQLASSTPLPPPSGPPPSHQLPPPQGPSPSSTASTSQAASGPLPPPAGPPPGFQGNVMPPPPGPPPGMMPGMPPPHMIRPMMPPPGYMPMPPPAGPPPGMQAQQMPSKQAEHKDAKPTIQAASTVVKMPRADQDRTVTSMVPASLRVRREAKPAAAPIARRQTVSAAPSAAPQVGADFGLAPSSAKPPPQAAVQRRPAVAGAGAFDKKYDDFMAEMAGLGALETA